MGIGPAETGGRPKMTSPYNYETRRDMIVTNAWETWTKNGLGLDAEMRRETEQTVQDTVNNTYIDGIDDLSWLAATLKRLGHE